MTATSGQAMEGGPRAPAHLLPPPGADAFPPGTRGPDRSHEAALRELRSVAGGAAAALFARTAGALQPRDVDVLITACSTFNPMPSSASVLMAHLGLRPDCEAYHLGGQACGVGPMTLALAGDVLAGLRARGRKPRRGASLNALVVVYENLTAGMYAGEDPAMLATTGLIRSGGAAAWVADRRRAGRGGAARAKYRLAAAGRWHTGAADPASLGAIGQRADAAGVVGSFFTGAIPKAAAAAVEGALRTVATAGLSARQLVRAVLDGRARRKAKAAGAPPPPRAPPPVWAAPAGRISHFALHPGIHAMLRGFVSSLGVPPAAALPSFAALRDFGNTSAPSTFYVLAYIESLGSTGGFGPNGGGVRKGQRVLQVGVGAGMKAGANVWVALRDVVRGSADARHAAWDHLGGVPVKDEDLPIPMAGADGGSSKGAAALMDGATGVAKALVGEE
jgi:3-ketoacyl-CoA synthase